MLCEREGEPAIEEHSKVGDGSAVRFGTIFQQTSTEIIYFVELKLSVLNLLDH